MTFAIRSEQRGRIDECLLRWFSMLRELFSACFSTNWQALWKDRFIDKAPAVGLIWPGVVGADPPFLYIYSKVALPRRTCQLKWLHIYAEIQSRSCNTLAEGGIEQCNWVNELHALIFGAFIPAARGVTDITLLHGLLYVWWVPQRRRLIKQSNFLLANCFEVWSKERKKTKEVNLLHCFLLPQEADC